MGTFAGMTAYDFFIAGLFAVLIGRGIWLGLLRQVTGFLALYLGYFVASRYHEQFFPMLQEISDNPKIVFLACYFLLFVATYLVIMLIGRLLNMVLSLTITSWFDRLLGGIVGFAKAAILAVLLHIIIGTVLSPENQMLRKCATCDVLNKAADFTREMIRSEKARKSFLQNQPAISLDTVKKYFDK